MRLQPQHHRYLYLFGLCLLAIGLPFSHFLMSISQIILLGNWLWEGDLKRKFSELTSSKGVWIFISLFVLHLIGLSYTQDLEYGLKDVRIKLPLLFLPLVIGTSLQLAEKEFRLVVSCFVGSVTLSSLLCMGVFLGFTEHVIESTRDISIFISHIRFGLNIVMALCFLGYFMFQQSANGVGRLLEGALFVWLTIFLFVLGSFTAIVLYGVVVFMLLFLMAKNVPHKNVRRGVVSAMVLAVVLPLLLVGLEWNRFYNIHSDDSNLIQHSPRGEKYIHNPDRKHLENGWYVYRYIAEEELKKAWNEKSTVAFDGKDHKGQILRTTLIRYMTSKGLKKDLDGMAQMAPKDIEAVENGIANYRFETDNFISTRIYTIIWETYHFRMGSNPESNSVGQRFEFWKTAFFIIQHNPIIGVGTGDNKGAFQEAYRETETLLSTKYQLRSHNQLFSFLVQFGILGGLWFLVAILFPIRANNGLKDYFFMVFFTIAFLSLMNEDTLETQAGATFFVFFYALLLWGRKKFPVQWPAKTSR